jgi:DNA-binding LytR/AlgR family response regulator
MEIKCLIVDDEELAQGVIEKYIETIPTLKLVGKCENAIEAISFLHSNKVDLLFLDLNMPELSGLDMLKTLNDPPKVIITTAYSEYALESYDFGVVDYLLKPIKLERFLKAVNKVVEQLSLNSKSETNQKDLTPATIFIKEDHENIQLNIADIQYIEAFGNYIKIHTSARTYLTRETIKHIEEKIPESFFLRIHKSFIINFQKIQKVSGNEVVIGDKKIPVGNTYKNELLKKMRQA